MFSEMMNQSTIYTFLTNNSCEEMTGHFDLGAYY